MSDSSKTATVVCSSIALICFFVGLAAFLRPRLVPIPWFAPWVFAVVSGTFALTFQDAEDNSAEDEEPRR